MDAAVVIILILYVSFALWLLHREGLFASQRVFFLCIVLVSLAIVLRAAVFGYETLDYQNFLARWVQFFRENGGFRALKYEVGNYNIPYLYFLALFSYLDISDLHLIKLLSVFFDIVLAYSAMKLLGLYQRSAAARLGIFFAVLFWPTVFLNGALWGQCDGVYVALAVLGIYLALDDRPVMAMVSMALSFGFKLQAVFLMPVFAALWFYGKLSWKHFFIFPLTYVLLVLPAVLLGRPFADTVLLYFSQTGSIGSGLNYNSPSVFALIRNVANEAAASRLAVLAAAAWMTAVLAPCLIFRRRMTGRTVLAAALLLSVGIPFFLPHMHDRYFYAADIIALVTAFAVPELAFTAMFAEFASLLGYHAYLKMTYLLTMDHGARALIAVLIAGAVLFVRSFSPAEKDESEKRKISA